MREKRQWGKWLSLLLAVVMMFNSQAVTVLAGTVGMVEIQNNEGQKSGPVDFTDWIISMGMWKLAGYDDVGDPIPGDVITEDAPVDHDQSVLVKISYKVPENVVVGQGDSITLELPEAIQAANGQNGPVKSAGGEQMGEYSIDENNKITITFTRDNITEGAIQFAGALKLEQTSEQDKTQTIQIGSQKLTVTVNPTETETYKNADISKKIVSEKWEVGDGGEAYKRITYRVRVALHKSESEVVKELVVEDMLGANADYASYDTSKGVSFDVNMTTSHTIRKRIEAGTFTITSAFDGKQAVFTLTDESEDGIYPDRDIYFTYDVLVKKGFYLDNPKGNLVNYALDNTAVVKIDDAPKDSSTERLYSWNTPVQKSVSLTPDGRIRYAVEVNSAQVSYQQAEEWILTDELSEGQTIDGDIEVMCWDEAWNWVHQYYGTIQGFDGKNKIELEVPPESGAYRWRYIYYAEVDKTKEGQNYSNSVTLRHKTHPEWTYTDRTGIGYANYGLRKEIRKDQIDAVNGLIGWKVRLDSYSDNGKFPEGTVYTDTLTAENGTHTFRQDDLKLSVAVKQNNGAVVLQEGSDYSAAVSGASFTVTFLREVQGPLELTYFSRASIGEKSSTSEGTVEKYKNRGELNVSGKKYSDTKEFQYSQNLKIKKYAGEYDQETNTIQWDIVVNEDKKDISSFYSDPYNGILTKPLVIKDTLPEGLEYASVRLYRFSESRNNWVEITRNCKITVSEDKKTATVSISQMDNKHKYRVRLATKVTGDLSSTDEKEFTNRAVAYYMDAPISHTDATAKIIAKKLDKKGLYNQSTAPNVKYTLLVNTAGEKLGNGSAIKVVDTMGAGLSLVPATMSVTDQNGNAVSRNEWSYSMGPEENQFTVILPNSRALKLTYEAFVNAAGQTAMNIENSASLYVDETTSVEVKVPQHIEVKNSSASAENTNPAVSVAKYSAADPSQTLDGAVFEFGKAKAVGNELQIDEKLKEITLTNGTARLTEKDGLAFNEWFYYKETKAPDGYILDGTVKFFMIPKGQEARTQSVPANGSLVSNETIFRVYNKNGSLTVEKKVTGEAPEEEIFYQMTVTGPDGGDLAAAVINGAVTSDGIETAKNGNRITFWMKKDGRVTITNIPIGTYTVTENVGEDAAYTASYQVNNGQAQTAASVELGAEHADGTVTVTNRYGDDFAGSVTLRKVGPEQEVLPGAVFRLYAMDEQGSSYEVYTGDNASGTYTTDRTGVITVDGLPANSYYFTETQAPAGYEIATEANGDAKQYPFTVGTGTKEEPLSDHADLTVVNEREAENGRLIVSKQLVYNNEQFSAVDRTFYVALYSDEALTNRVSEIRPIVFQNAGASSTEFTDLAPGKTYYVAELDSAGNILNGVGGMAEDGTLYTPHFGSGNSTVIENGQSTQTVSFENVYMKIPEQGYYRDGELTVTKQLLDINGNAKSSTETFYAGIFADEGYTVLADQVSENIVALNLNGGSEAGKTVQVTIVPGTTQTLYVTEVDENGKPVADSASFKYDVTVEGSVVSLDEANSTASVRITNQENEETEEEESDTEVETDTKKQTDNGKEMKDGIKTGDETPILPFVLLLAVSAGLLLFLGMKRRKNKG